MKLSCVVWLWSFLSGFEIASTAEIHRHGYSGKDVMITCSHVWASENIKYFCRDPCKYKTGSLVSSIQPVFGRYRLEDLGNGTFTVTITDLQESDTGKYWCGVERSIKDTYEKITLDVYKDPNQSIATSTQADIHTLMDLPTATPAAYSECPSTRTCRSSPDAITLPPSVSASVHTLRYAITGLILAVIVLLVGLSWIYQYRKRVKTSETATSTERSNERTGENHTEMTSTGTYEDMTTHSYLIYQNIDLSMCQVNESEGNL